MSSNAVVSAGGLLPVDLLARVAANDSKLEGTSPEDYGLAPGERLNDEITRSWNRLRGLWETFSRLLAELPESERTATELTRSRWTRPLLDELGFGGLPVARDVEIDGKSYPVSHAWAGTVPVHLPGARILIDRRTPGVPGAAHMSPHGLVQELLNRSDRHLWGLVTNGLTLRLLRDNASLTRQAYVEFDLQAIFGGELFSDFVTLWLTCHRTRFEGDIPEKCLLERWSQEAVSSGTRALDKLRTGVETAIATLGEGFVAHPANAELRDALRSGAVSATEYQHQLLRVVYRLLFLLVAESRDLLLDPDGDPTAKERYRRFYSVDRLRRLAMVRRGTSHADLWDGLTVTMRALWRDGAPALALAPLGSGLWSPESIAALDGALIDNRHLLGAIRALSAVRDDASRVDRPVDYRNLGAEELGSIYESLLELHAEVDPDARSFRLGSAAGNERKTTGSYYTPTSLITVLLDSALDPVLDEAAKAPDPEAALLGLNVLDPACGSGHFLIAAAHRIAGRLASIRCGGGEPAPDELRHALREVIGRCLHGIDVNPMAVELCKVSLWMEATEPGRPLSFLDHRIVCGNALLGATPALIEAGVPDDAFKPLEGDDKTWVTTLKKRNKEERKNRNQGVLDFGSPVAADAAALAKELDALDALDDTSVAGIAAKEQRYAALQASDAAQRAKLVADAWCAAFVAPKAKGEPVITDATVRQCGSAPERVPADVRAAIDAVAADYRFLHLHIAFPDVFAVPDSPAGAENRLCGWNGGFDVVLGNPPWERVKLQEKEWFAARDPRIAAAPNAAARKRLIANLVHEFPEMHAAFLADSRKAEGESALLRNSGRFPLGGRGDVNTYAVFAELMRNAISTTGRAGVIVPTGIATDDTTKFFFADLVDRASLVSLFDFENRLAVFPGVHRSYKFALLTMSGDARPILEAEFVFFALETADLDDPEKRFTLAPEDFALLNPNTKTCPVFRTRRDAEITKAIYRRVPVLVREGDPDGNPWGVSFQRMFDMANDSHLFRTRSELEMDGWKLGGNVFVRGGDQCLPLFEAKMIHLFDHRWSTYENASVREVTEIEKSDANFVAMPRYWVPRAAVDAKLDLNRGWLVGWRDIARSTDERTLIVSAWPRGAAADTFLQLVPTRPSGSSILLLAAALSSLVVDYCARQKVGGTHLKYHVFKQLAVCSPAHLRDYEDEVLSRYLELVYTTADLAPLAHSVGYQGAPFRWDPERRILLKAELDARFFTIFGLDRDGVAHVLESFPIMRRREEALFGEYRTSLLVLELYDRMVSAIDAGAAYVSILD